ncbi:MAG: tRNA (adenosine(37)-N6)-threonylcarbamoyltransferase complex ATPase subunit type 1 TsaE [Lentimicrobium sp.]|jgi:tRNA threonylcarbamoyladenosine biosynthesis protein TsaE|nr:tRNA (adenosine(37)-N6)-threonylcarbamoyltransferase complex ATPase subunit type 1 TsaE [Lentimicrobium sp.]MDD2526650.1 tRNA (adenosine(37)-N6)-threonylcarbamoyltransferase complex ATPase subunit type 1 TsaE [Lentimicrobiaceae bacterium]MDD4596834.1 tRNA (adenosine(37)-N6)-threonylcarbamoyltransferase complex ATPase subunit type 1 TsaE [Lentimicrobiaceae bacterium]MDY0025307.1 tRNA (adenosine(37)-N6)-threonylcarbamoyltransferase complex ATPase subunit type 1 TsaE [Lentimicrobium sp.]HAH6035
MKMLYNRVANLGELDEVAAEIIDGFPRHRIFALSGEMGAGKTTLVQAMCRHLKVTDTVNSPTFSIVNEYITTENHYVYHFDLYRLRKPQELPDIGAEDYFYSGNYCFIEWPEMAEQYIPDEALVLRVTVSEDGKRIFTIN